MYVIDSSFCRERERALFLSSFVQKSDIQQFGTTYTAMKPSSNSDV
jgi:hypothetical protein